MQKSIIVIENHADRWAHLP